MQRRHFLHRGSALLMAGSPLIAWADDDRSRRRRGEHDRPAPVANPQPTGPAKHRVIVIGGGMAGATVAKYLRLWGDSVDVARYGCAAGWRRHCSH